MAYTSRKVRDWDIERQRIMARVFDPSTTKAQLEADMMRLEILKRRCKEEITRIDEDRIRMEAESEALQPVIARDWQRRRENGIVSRIWHTFTYLVFAQRIGHHLFKK